MDTHQLAFDTPSTTPTLPPVKTALCYVNPPWAYFTNQPLKDQWGDDWDDAPYEHNAGEPYEYGVYDDKSKRQPFTITKVAYTGHLEAPEEYSGPNSRYSVEMINAGAVAWLVSPSWDDKNIAIPAGTSLEDFERLVGEAGGKVFKA